MKIPASVAEGNPGSVAEPGDVETLPGGHRRPTGPRREAIHKLTHITAGLETTGDRPQRVARLNDHLDRRRRGVGTGTGRVGGCSGRHRPGGGSVGAEEIEYPEDGEGDKEGEAQASGDRDQRPTGRRMPIGTTRPGDIRPGPERGHEAKLGAKGPVGLEIPGGGTG